MTILIEWHTEGHILPAIYTLLSGDGARLGNELDFVSLNVNRPVHFYFTNESNTIIKTDTPILMLIVNY